MIIGNFQSKQELQDVITALRNKGRNFYCHFTGGYKKLIDRVIQDNWGLEGLNMELWNRQDNGKPVFSFVKRETRNYINASDFILNDKSANWIVLNELIKANNGGKNYCTYSELKNLLRVRSVNSLYNALLELRKMGVSIGKTKNDLYLIHKPDSVIIGFNNIYSGINKQKKLTKLYKELSPSGLIDSNNLVKEIIDKSGFDNTKEGFIKSFNIIIEYWINEMKRLWK